MATAFIGLTVIVKLKNPRGLVLRGLVVNVYDQRLFLDNVYDVSRQWPIGQANFLGIEIEDIEVAPHAPAFVGAPHPQQLPPPLPTPASVPNPPTQNSVVDPAIVSFARDQAHHSQLPPAVASLKPQPVTQQVQLQPSQIRPITNVSATLTTPFNHHTVPSQIGKFQPPEHNGNGRADKGSLADASNIVRKKKNNQGKNARLPALDVTNQSSPETKKTRSTGWRQTPILVDSASPAKLQPGPQKRSRKQLQQLQFEEQNGDASDIQDLPAFDFTGNNAKFDKKAAFEQIRIDDTTADEDRLVSHNRLPKPGTFGGSKLHPTEMVLDRPRQDSNDVAFSDSDDDVANLGASISSLKIRPTRLSIKRKDNSLTKEAVSRVPRSDSKGRLGSSYSLVSPSHADPSSPSISASKPRKPTLRNASTNQICLAVPPSILHAAEALATKQLTLQEQSEGLESYSLTPDLLAENAARSIAEIALSAINPGGRRVTKANVNPDPVVVILASESEASARAIAAGRHLLERGVRVIVTLLDAGNHDGPALAHIDRQLERFHGKQMDWDDLPTYLRSLDAPPELILDGLFGAAPTTRFAALPAAARADALAIMAWANKSRAAVLALDLPAGVDPDTGAVAIVDGEPAEVRARLVVACGAPCVGLLRALQARHADGSPDEWKMWVVDIGVAGALRSLVKKRHRDAVGFGGAWAVGLRFDEGGFGASEG